MTSVKNPCDCHGRFLSSKCSMLLALKHPDLSHVVGAVVVRVGAVGVGQAVTSTVGNWCCSVRSVCNWCNWCNWCSVAQQQTSLVPWCVRSFCARQLFNLFRFCWFLCSEGYSEQSQENDSLKTTNIWESGNDVTESDRIVWHFIQLYMSYFLF